MRLLILIAILWLLFSTCRTPQRPGGEEAFLDTLQLASPAFEPGGTVPVRYTCLGEGVSPPLVWSVPPAQTESLVLTLERLQGGREAREDVLLWVVYNLPPERTVLPEGRRLRLVEEAADEAVQGVNHFGTAGYDGPCPSAGEATAYAFRIFALRTRLPPDALRSGASAYDAMRGYVLARGELDVTFGYPTR